MEDRRGPQGKQRQDPASRGPGRARVGLDRRPGRGKGMGHRDGTNPGPSGSQGTGATGFHQNTVLQVHRMMMEADLMQPIAGNAGQVIHNIRPLGHTPQTRGSPQRRRGLRQPRRAHPVKRGDLPPCSDPGSQPQTYTPQARGSPVCFVDLPPGCGVHPASAGISPVATAPLRQF